MSPVSLSIYMLGYPLLSVLLMVALGSELFINMYLNIVILLGLCTALGGWHWWRSRYFRTVISWATIIREERCSTRPTR